MDEFEGMEVYDPGEDDINTTKMLFSLQYSAYDIIESSIKYLTYISGGSSKFHAFWLATDKDGNYYAFNAYARIGYSPRIHRIIGPTSQETAMGALRRKLRKKENKGYTNRTSEFLSAEEMALIVGTIDGDPALLRYEQGRRDAFGYYTGKIITDESEIEDTIEMFGEMPGNEERQKKAFKKYKRNVWGTHHDAYTAEGMEMTPDIEGYPGLPVVPDSYGTNSALASGQGVPVWYGSAESKTGGTASNYLFDRDNALEREWDELSLWEEQMKDGGDPDTEFPTLRSLYARRKEIDEQRQALAKVHLGAESFEADFTPLGQDYWCSWCGDDEKASKPQNCINYHYHYEQDNPSCGNEMCVTCYHEGLCDSCYERAESFEAESGGDGYMAANASQLVDLANDLGGTIEITSLKDFEMNYLTNYNRHYVSGDEVDFMFHDGSMATCIQDPVNVLSTFVEGYSGDAEDEDVDYDRYSFKHTDLEVTHPLKTGFLLGMGWLLAPVVAGLTAAGVIGLLWKGEK